MLSSVEGWGKGEEPGGCSELRLHDTTAYFDYNPVLLHEPCTYPAQIFEENFLWAANTLSPTVCKVARAAQKQHTGP